MNGETTSVAPYYQIPVESEWTDMAAKPGLQLPTEPYAQRSPAAQSSDSFAQLNTIYPLTGY